MARQSLFHCSKFSSNTVSPKAEGAIHGLGSYIGAPHSPAQFGETHLDFQVPSWESDIYAL
ncbi:MAG TPA: hypothetical protein VHA33_19595 [Candidatus Angelobacter sp.]|nr:hypothetical protein [Candidatus Angelobacter sp.]